MRLMSLAVLGLCCSSGFAVTIAREGQATAEVVVGAQATPGERHVADELAKFLGQMTGATFQVRVEGTNAQAGGQDARPPAETQNPQSRIQNRLLVGVDAAKLADPSFKVDDLGADGLVIRTVGNDLILAGGQPRGTLYAVYEFLHRQGCRWWTPKAATIPSKKTLDVPAMDVRFVPRFEYREPFWFDAFDGDWAVRNHANGATERLDEAHGGKHIWEGFVHTFFPLVPPDKYFKDHPEWYSEVDGKRGHEHAQLCLTNDELRAELVRNLKARLKANPGATIASVSQNDWAGWCRCPKCAAIDAEEGSQAGSMIRFVNQVAEEIEGEFPKVAICTLAYQYTRKPPAKARPRHNVIVQLCSIECSFSKPLTDEVNKAFRNDIVGWSKICDRLYIWDYTTNFRHYLLPHPNLRVLGPNVQFFAEHGVKGVFEQGAYQSSGAEMAELRSWVLARMLWDPTQDAAALTEEFIDGYYGPTAPQIREWIKLTHEEVARAGDFLGCFSGADAAFLTLPTLSRGAELMEQAMKAAGSDANLQMRIRAARLPILYTFLIRWSPWRVQAAQEARRWPVADNVKALWEQVREDGKALNVVYSSESRKLETLAEYAEQPDRHSAAPPSECTTRPAGDWAEVQDHGFDLHGHGRSKLVADPKASDGAAARMTGDHNEWAVQRWLRLPIVEANPQARFRVKLAIRCIAKGQEGRAFQCGLYENRAAKHVAVVTVQAKDLSDDEYGVYDLGPHQLVPWMLVWVAPCANQAVESVWVDRLWLVREQ